MFQNFILPKIPFDLVCLFPEVFFVKIPKILVVLQDFLQFSKSLLSQGMKIIQKSYRQDASATK